MSFFNNKYNVKCDKRQDVVFTGKANLDGDVLLFTIRSADGFGQFGTFDPFFGEGRSESGDAVLPVLPHQPGHILLSLIKTRSAPVFLIHSQEKAPFLCSSALARKSGLTRSSISRLNRAGEKLVGGEEFQKTGLEKIKGIAEW